MDMLDKIYQELITDEYIKEQASGRIKFYEYLATGNVTGPYIVIDPLSPPIPSDYGDNEPISDEYLYQVDVWTKNRKTTKEIAKRVQAVMRSLWLWHLWWRCG
ncbi:DUF3168 domain-containing protein [Cytobacillus oceanisediminis]|uniref:Uncharacterized protein DUF3168 n=1 Tax=Cytobacillus oceanisediminis TaxID=665099 RepID=A0A562JWA8_9BACI|nr:DUF3168 domain-containing protein [Cytobacillus oceanisediminis]TWH87461.1 uncharacterized protein DUF3168 [Cytobacillus oceanisediminis]